MTKDTSVQLVTDLCSAAYGVAVSPSVGAYRSNGARKGVPRHQLHRLIKALLAADVLSESAQEELTARLTALDAAEADAESWRQAEAERQAARAAQ